MKAFPVIIVAFLLGFVTFPLHALEFHTSAKQAVIMDYQTGQILFEKNARERMPTSSMSKVMTMYLVFEALKDGRLSMDTELLVSEKAWRKGGSKMFVEVGKRVRVEDLIQGVIVQSGNDATIVLAEALAGTEDAFAEALTKKANELGMNDSQFKNASGWPDPDHYSTAYDLALLARALVQNFPQYYHFYSQREFTFNDIKQRNRNPLIYRDIGADGIKTGHTEVGGYGLIASGKRDGRRVLVVVNGLKDEKARAQESARLLEWGLRAFDNIEIFQAGETVGDAEVALGVSKTVPLTVKDRVFVTIPKENQDQLKVELVYTGPIEAPVKEGYAVGELVVTLPDEHVLSYDVETSNDVDRLGLFQENLAKLKIMLMGRKGTE